MMKQDHLPTCTVINPGNTPPTAELHKDTRIWIEFLYVPKHYMMTTMVMMTVVVVVVVVTAVTVIVECAKFL